MGVMAKAELEAQVVLLNQSNEMVESCKITIDQHCTRLSMRVYGRVSSLAVPALAVSQDSLLYPD